MEHETEKKTQMSVQNRSLTSRQTIQFIQKEVKEDLREEWVNKQHTSYKLPSAKHLYLTSENIGKC